MGYEHPLNKGRGKTPGSGRKKGTPNKRTAFKVSDILKERGINPVDEVMRELPLIEDAKDRAKIWLELLSYCEAKPRVPDEPSSKEPNPEDFEDLSVDDLLKIVKNEDA